MTERRLPGLSSASGERTDTGTRVRSESGRGSSPRCSKTERKPSVIAVSATSLMVTSNFRHTCSTSASGTRTAR